MVESPRDLILQNNLKEVHLSMKNIAQKEARKQLKIKTEMDGKGFR
ncbi:MAG: hypothetical protein HS132_15655 [Planctomycetia bacterium]|nr:hypothetical protein [Planctomycetia bacterium]